MGFARPAQHGQAASDGRQLGLAQASLLQPGLDVIGLQQASTPALLVEAVWCAQEDASTPAAAAALRASAVSNERSSSGP